MVLQLLPVLITSGDLLPGGGDLNGRRWAGQQPFVVGLKAGTSRWPWPPSFSSYSLGSTVKVQWRTAFTRFTRSRALQAMGWVLPTGPFNCRWPNGGNLSALLPFPLADSHPLDPSSTGSSSRSSY